MAGDRPTRARGAGPLGGRRVVVTRPRAQAAELTRRAQSLGATVISCPAIATRAPERLDLLDAALARIAAYDWIAFTSASAVNAVADGIARLTPATSVFGTGLAACRVAAVGPATRAALAARGVNVAFLPDTYSAAALARELPVAAGARVLFPRSDVALPDLADGLRARGVRVDEVTAYRVAGAARGDTRVTRVAALMCGGRIDALTFTSPSTAHHFIDALDAAGGRAVAGRTMVACIGPATARAVRERDWAVDAVATRHTSEGLVDAMVEWFAARADGARA